MVGEIYTVGIQGINCGAPFSLSLAYLQVQPTDGSGGEALATAFWDANNAVSPGSLWLGASSNKLQPQCMSWSSPTDIGSAIIDARSGELATPAMPPTAAVLFHLRPRSPWPGQNYAKPRYDIGRFYLPGLVIAQTKEWGLTTTAISDFRAIGGSLLEIFVDETETFRLVPFPKFEANPDGGELTVRSAEPDALVRRVGTRRPNACELYAGTGQTGGRPLVGSV